MKEFFEIIEKDYHSEGFTRKEWIIYGIVTPLALGALVLLGGIIEHL